MAALSEKLIWPIVGIFIFGALAGMYIDDRRRLAEEGTSTKQASSEEHGGKSAEHGGKSAESKHASSEHAGKSAENKHTSKDSHKADSANSKPTQRQQVASATSMSMDEYLSTSTDERSAELEANVTHHQGFSGGIDEYLSGGKPKADKKSNAEHAGKSAEHAGKSAEKKSSHQASGATSMSMEEYQAKSEQGQHGGSASSGDAYHGDMDGYLAKYGDGKQTSVSNSSQKPFNKKEHMGFHGSYEEYAKKYN